MNNWRGLVADTAHVLSTPVTAFDEMDWAEVLLNGERLRVDVNALRRA